MIRINKIEEFNDYIKNLDHEVSNDQEWLEIHIHEMINEIIEIEYAIKIFKIVDGEWKDNPDLKGQITYSPIRTTLYNSLVYRVLLGLSKIFIGKQEFSLVKTVNKISQMENYRNDKEIMTIINEIREYVDNDSSIAVLSIYRDKFFAHLDKHSVISDLRVSPTFAMNGIEGINLNDTKALLTKLYNSCFKREQDFKVEKINKDVVLKAFMLDI